MIAPEAVQRIREMLREGTHPQRKIARLTGVSRGTVGAIALGRRPDYPAKPRSGADDSSPFTGPLQRCPGCGGMVFMPCRMCQARSIKERASRRLVPQWLEQLSEPLGFDLREDDRRRYEQVHRQMLAQQASELQSRCGEADDGTTDDMDACDASAWQEAELADPWDELANDEEWTASDDDRTVLPT